MNCVDPKIFYSITNKSDLTSDLTEERKYGKGIDSKQAKALPPKLRRLAITLAGVTGGALLISQPAMAGQLCVTGGSAASQTSIGQSTSVLTSCGPNASNILSSNHDLAILEAAGSAAWVDGTDLPGFLRPLRSSNNGVG
jgi:hypothetical protein